MGLKPFWIKKNDTVHKVGGVAIPAHYPASKITYDNTDSGLVATDAQDAIDELNDAIDEINDTSVTPVSGNPISISGLKSNQLAINPIITFEPIQAGSGTPSPSNIRAISGYDKVEVESCGKNLWKLGNEYINPSEHAAISSIIYTNGGVILTASGVYARVQYVFNVKVGQTYTISLKGNCTGNYKAVYVSNAATESGSYGFIQLTETLASYSLTFTADTNVLAVLFYINTDYTSGIMTIQDFQLELGNEATTYEPCNKTTSISESLGQTVYWGRLDVRSGEFDVLGVRVYLPDLSWLQYQSNLWISYSLNDLVSAAIYPKILPPDTNNDVVEAVCEKYQIDDVVTLSANQTTNIGIGANADGTMFFATGNGSENTPTGYMVYKLLEPFTIQLTPHEISLLKDYAYVSTNGTTISFSYHNGEIASLADVSQLGETVNELGKMTEITSQLFNVPTGVTVRAFKSHNMVLVNVYYYPDSGSLVIANNTILADGLPKASVNVNLLFNLSLNNTNPLTCVLVGGQLKMYYPLSTSATRILGSFCYFI